MSVFLNVQEDPMSSPPEDLGVPQIITSADDDKLPSDEELMDMERGAVPVHPLLPHEAELAETHSTIQVVPGELVFEIMSYLSAQDLCTARLLSRHWTSCFQKHLTRFPQIQPYAYHPQPGESTWVAARNSWRVKHNYKLGVCRYGTLEKVSHSVAAVSSDGCICLSRWQLIAVFARVGHQGWVKTAYLAHQHDHVLYMQFCTLTGTLYACCADGAIRRWLPLQEKLVSVFDAVANGIQARDGILSCATESGDTFDELDFVDNAMESHKCPTYLIFGTYTGHVGVFSVELQTMLCVSFTGDVRVTKIRFINMGNDYHQPERHIAAQCQSAIAMLSFNTVTGTISILCTFTVEAPFMDVAPKGHALRCICVATKGGRSSYLSHDPNAVEKYKAEAIALHSTSTVVKVSVVGAALYLGTSTGQVVGLFHSQHDRAGRVDNQYRLDPTSFITKPFPCKHTSTIDDITLDEYKLFSTDVHCNVHAYDLKTLAVLWQISLAGNVGRFQKSLIDRDARANPNSTRRVAFSNGTMVLTPLGITNHSLICDFDVDPHTTPVATIKPDDSTKTHRILRVYTSVWCHYAIYVCGPPIVILLVAMFVHLLTFRLDGIISTPYAYVFIPHWLALPYYCLLDMKFYRRILVFGHNTPFLFRATADALYLVGTPLLYVLKMEGVLDVSFAIVFTPLAATLLCVLVALIYERWFTYVYSIGKPKLLGRITDTLANVGILLWGMVFVILVAHYFDDPTSMNLYVVFAPVWIALVLGAVVAPRFLSLRDASCLVSVLTVSAMYILYIAMLVVPTVLFCMKYEAPHLSVPLYGIMMPLHLFLVLLLFASVANVRANIRRLRRNH